VSNLFLVYILFELVTICFFYMFFCSHFKANEFVLKYYVYAVFMEILLLFGFCYMYLAFGSLDILDILQLVSGITEINNFLLISLFLILLSFFFKIGVFPFHFYIIDLYKNSSFSAIALFSILPKFIYFYFINFFIKILLNL